jgi:hypothetical protein
LFRPTVWRLKHRAADDASMVAEAVDMNH